MNADRSKERKNELKNERKRTHRTQTSRETQEINNK